MYYIPLEIYIGIAACTTSKHRLSQKRRENPYGWYVKPTAFQMYISYGVLDKNPVCSVDRGNKNKLLIISGKEYIMKKLFVSVPMKGRTEEEIRKTIDKMKKIAEIFEGEELELIESYIEDNPPKDNNQAIWFLGESLKKLAQADVFVGITGAWDWNGCQIESDVASRYGIKKYAIPPQYVIDNYNELIEKH